MQITTRRMLMDENFESGHWGMPEGKGNFLERSSVNLGTLEDNLNVHIRSFHSLHTWAVYDTSRY
jgi:hypothetical protein